MCIDTERVKEYFGNHVELYLWVAKWCLVHSISLFPLRTHSISELFSLINICRIDGCVCLLTGGGWWRASSVSCVMPSIKRCKRWSHLVTCPARKLLYIHFITFISQHRYQTKNTEHLKWAPQCLGFLTCVFWTLSLKILFTCLPIVFLLIRWFGNFKCNFLSLICMNS